MLSTVRCYPPVGSVLQQPTKCTCNNLHFHPAIFWKKYLQKTGADEESGNRIRSRCASHASEGHPHLPELTALLLIPSLEIINRPDMTDDLTNEDKDDENKGKEEKLVFPAEASVEGIRTDEIVYKKSGNDWIKETLWIKDSIKVSQRCLVVDLETKQDTICNVTYRTLVGADSVLEKTSSSHSCETLSEGDIYQFDFHYVVFRKRECNDDCSAINTALSYRLDRTEIHD